MTERREKPEPLVPEIGKVVIYRSQAGVDMPAIITALAPVDDDDVQRSVFLTLFPPPGEAADAIDRTWGVSHGNGIGDSSFERHWRWPEEM